MLCKRGVKYPELVRNTSKVSTSLMLTATASGELLPPYVVYKSKKVWTTWQEGGPDGAKYDCSKSGWFDACTFENYFFRILLPHAKKKDGIKAVICDNLASHVSERVLAACRKYSIKFIFLPPNSTHWTQPLDVAFFAPMKRKWRKLLARWKASQVKRKRSHSEEPTEGEANTSLTLPKDKFPRLLKVLWDELQENAETNLKNGFRACGIVPVNVEELLKKLPRVSAVDTDVVGASFIGFVQQQREDVIASGPARKRKATTIVAGTVRVCLNSQSYFTTSKLVFNQNSFPRKKHLFR